MLKSSSDSLAPVPREMPRSWRFDAVTPTFWSQVREVWQFRSMFPFLFVRALFIVYRKSVLGIGWLFINTVAVTLPIALVLGNVLGLDTDGLPPSIFILSGLSIWMMFSYSTRWMMRSLSINSYLTKNFSVPPLLSMTAMIADGMVAFFIVEVMVIGAVAYTLLNGGSVPLDIGWNLLLFFPAFVMAAAMAIALSSFTSILNYILSDTLYILRYVMGAWMLLSPIAYSSKMIDPSYRTLYYLNPAAGVIDLHRYALFGTTTISAPHVLLSATVLVILLLLGMWFFLNFQRKILDFS